MFEETVFVCPVCGYAETRRSATPVCHGGRWTLGLNGDRGCGGGRHLPWHGDVKMIPAKFDGHEWIPAGGEGGE